jgi:hypothetical protein
MTADEPTTRAKRDVNDEATEANERREDLDIDILGVPRAVTGTEKRAARGQRTRPARR